MEVLNMEKEWDGFKKGKWNESVDVSSFIALNYKL